MVEHVAPFVRASMRSRYAKMALKVTREAAVCLCCDEEALRKIPNTIALMPHGQEENNGDGIKLLQALAAVSRRCEMCVCVYIVVYVCMFYCRVKI